MIRRRGPGKTTLSVMLAEVIRTVAAEIADLVLVPTCVSPMDIGWTQVLLFG